MGPRRCSGDYPPFRPGRRLRGDSAKPLAEGAPHPEPPEPVRLGIEQSYTEVEALKWLGPIYDEDTGNLDMQQKGFKTSGKAGITLATIRNPEFGGYI